jgi:CYTH domain-containing protein
MPGLILADWGCGVALEIERKYLVTAMASWVVLPAGLPIVQGYLSETGGITVRVRRKGDRGFLTIKAPPRAETPAGTIAREEFEYEIPAADAEALLMRCDRTIRKVRYVLETGMELDVFEGRHAGLVLAEFESTDGAQAPPVPGIEWIEVSGDRRYSNSWMARHGIPPR